ncbi:hypothetical protein Ancab_019073 [Ancistrocladus abbreviatus]
MSHEAGSVCTKPRINTIDVEDVVALNDQMQRVFFLKLVHTNYILQCAFLDLQALDVRICEYEEALYDGGVKFVGHPPYRSVVPAIGLWLLDRPSAQWRMYIEKNAMKKSAATNTIMITPIDMLNFGL